MEDTSRLISMGEIEKSHFVIQLVVDIRSIDYYEIIVNFCLVTLYHVLVTEIAHFLFQVCNSAAKDEENLRSLQLRLFQLKELHF